MKDYTKEKPLRHLIARHWDELEIKERLETFVQELSNGGTITPFFVGDSSSIDQAREFFKHFETRRITFRYTAFQLFYKVAADDDYNDLRGQLLFKFQVDNSEHTVLLMMARLRDAENVEWKIADVLWYDEGIDCAPQSLDQLEAPKKNEEICLLKTDIGEIGLRLFPEQAPFAVKNWIELAKQGFYDDTPFARVIKEFVIQGGALDGSGEEAVSSYDGYFEDEVDRGLYHFNGACALGNHGPHTNGNQFFIVQNTKVDADILPQLSLPENVKEMYLSLGGLPELDGRYTVFGQVFRGLDVVAAIADQPTNSEDAPLQAPVKIRSIQFIIS
ncbi:hypothetical protein NRIC_35100 [Enterococcus florum]|uniref:peptidylprolyl isomerase n=1 Tax=Enterococcus florum TaxID=2480627 RepID=A0A4V0WPZ9_9ENTE|nr:peptidylprolyl isomerase [Enterococcus florum]GCF95619.1 hypothetical protein NRIC_35100 [Enterococcus florum]